MTYTSSYVFFRVPRLGRRCTTSREESGEAGCSISHIDGRFWDARRLCHFDDKHVIKIFLLGSWNRGSERVARHDY
jgi:hypothetical protein